MNDRRFQFGVLDFFLGITPLAIVIAYSARTFQTPDEAWHGAERVRYITAALPIGFMLFCAVIGAAFGMLNRQTKNGILAGLWSAVVIIVVLSVQY